MEKIMVLLLLSVLLFLSIFVLACQPSQPDLEMVCCQECADAFSQSPIGVGAVGVECGEFGSAKPISKNCIVYFEENPLKVSECQLIVSS